MITVDNPDTVKQVKALVELMNTQGKLVNVQREGAFKGVKLYTYRYPPLQLELRCRVCDDVTVTEITRTEPKVFIVITSCPIGNHYVIQINNQKALDVVLLEYQFML